jgi:hypothetical protein
LTVRRTAIDMSDRKSIIAIDPSQDRSEVASRENIRRRRDGEDHNRSSSRRQSEWIETSFWLKDRWRYSTYSCYLVPRVDSTHTVRGTCLQELTDSRAANRSNRSWIAMACYRLPQSQALSLFRAIDRV